MALLSAGLLCSCTHTPSAAGEALAKDIAHVVESEAKVKAALIAVDAPKLGLTKFKSVAGEAHVDSAFLSASIGKLFVATCIMKMAEKGELKTSDRLSKYIDTSLLGAIFSRGHERVTIDMLLRHTSGAGDYFSGTSHDGSPNVLDLIRLNPQRKWSRQELLDYGAAHFSQMNAPGEEFYYSDTNYDLLGLVIESVSNEPFARRVRSEIIDPLELRNTWYHAFEPARRQDLVQTFVGDTLVTHLRSRSTKQVADFTPLSMT